MKNNEIEKDVLKELTMGQIKFHKSRNLVMGVAVVLTTLLLSFVYTAGFSFISTMKESSDAAPGPREDGALVGTLEQYQQIKEKEQVIWADLVRKCSTSSLRNDEFAGVQTELLAPDSDYFTHNEIMLQTGTFPIKSDEIVISDTLAEKLDIKTAETELNIQVMIQKNGSAVEITIPMAVCGIYRNPLANLSDTYEEIYTAKEFITENNPQLEENQNHIYVKLNNLNPLALKSDVYEKLEELRIEVGADYVMTKSYTNFLYSFIAVIPMFLFTFLIMLSGYFLIYNVFSISIAMDVKWFGLMKTIGATQKQISRIYSRQLRFLAVLGVLAGTLTGYFLGLLVAPQVLKMTSFSIFFVNASLLPVAVFTIFFAWITIKIGSARIIKKAAGLSPVEASRFVLHRRKKLVTVLSFALSGIILLSVCNVVFGFQEEYMVARRNQEEVKIWHKASVWSIEESYQPLSENLTDELKKLPFLNTIDLIYMAKTMPDIIETSGIKLYEGFLGKVRLEGKLKRETDAAAKIMGTSEALNRTEDGNIKLQITGLPAERIEKEARYFKILEGKLDSEVFADGDYILYQSMGYRGINADLPKEDKIHAGDILTLNFYDDIRKGYFEKNVEVMAVIEINDSYGAGNVGYSNIVMPDVSFQEIYPDYMERIARIEIGMERDITENELMQIKDVIRQEHNVQINMDSRYEDRAYYVEQKQSITIIGVFFACIMAVIGVSNLINTLVMDTIFKKDRFAVLQSIGMTEKQLTILLFQDSLKLCGAATAIMLVVGGFTTSVIASASMFTGFDISLFIIEVTGIVLFAVLMSGALAYGMTKWLNKKTLVERLRENI